MSEAPERPQGGDDPLPDVFLHYTTTTATMLENAHGDKFVKLLMPVFLDQPGRFGVSEADANSVLMSRVLRAAGRAATEVEMMSPAAIAREAAGLTDVFRTSGGKPLPHRPERPEGEE